MELQTDLDCPQGKDDIEIPTSMELKSARIRRYQNSHPHGTSNWLGRLTRANMASKFPPPWNFKLTWTVNEDKIESKFRPPWNFKLTWTVHKDKMKSKFPPPWNFKLTWAVHKDTVISKSPSPWNFKLILNVHTGKTERRYQNSHLHGTSNWLGPFTKAIGYQNSRSRGPSN